MPGLDSGGSLPRVGQGLHGQLSATLLKHLEEGKTVDGQVMCRCKRQYDNDRQYAQHLAAVTEEILGSVVEQERVNAQIRLLVGAARYWSPTAGANARSRTAYTGAQIAGWCRDKAMALHRTSGQKTASDR